MCDNTLYKNEDVKESRRRLPENVYNDQMFCIKRALDLTMRQQTLPKNQWTKYKEDKLIFISKLYFQPYPKDIKCERKENEEWNKK
uniref:Cytochrome b-c1 complex subunit 7 n=1 Tax=Monodelphis domestica TaxID=13616 RepID=A0A5F8G369_MONDO